MRIFESVQAETADLQSFAATQARPTETLLIHRAAIELCECGAFSWRLWAGRRPRWCGPRTFRSPGSAASTPAPVDGFSAALHDVTAHGKGAHWSGSTILAGRRDFRFLVALRCYKGNPFSPNKSTDCLPSSMIEASSANVSPLSLMFKCLRTKLLLQNNVPRQIQEASSFLRSGVQSRRNERIQTDNLALF